MTPKSTSPESRLRELLARVFADGVLEAHERDELRSLYVDASLSVPVVRAIFTEFIQATYEEVMAGGVVTGDEREKLRAIVVGLRLPESCVPAEVRRILDV